MTPSLLDRVVSILAYFTFGVVSIIWLIYAYVTKTRTSRFLSFNLYQAIFLSIVFTVISMIYNIAIELMEAIPFVGKIANRFDIFFNGTPLYFSFTVSGLIVTLIICYLSLLCLIGKKAYIPFASDIISSINGG